MDKLIARLKSLFGDAGAWFNALSTRERRLVVLAGSAAGIFFLFVTLFSLSSAAGSTQRRTLDKLGKLEEIQSLAANYSTELAIQKDAERRLANNGIRLISYINEKGNAAGLDIQTLNPKPDMPVGEGNILESAVEFSLNDIKIRSLVEFLNSLEVGGMVKVKNLRLEPRVANETVTAWLTVATYRLK